MRHSVRGYAYRELGSREIPILVIDAMAEDSLVISLVENIARRQHRPIDLLQDIEGIKRRGHNKEHIGARRISWSSTCAGSGHGRNARLDAPSVMCSDKVDILEAIDIGGLNA